MCSWPSPVWMWCQWILCSMLALSTLRSTEGIVRCVSVWQSTDITQQHFHQIQFGIFLFTHKEFTSLGSKPCVTFCFCQHSCSRGLVRTGARACEFALARITSTARGACARVLITWSHFLPRWRNSWIPGTSVIRPLRQWKMWILRCDKWFWLFKESVVVLLTLFSVCLF